MDHWVFPASKWDTGDTHNEMEEEEGGSSASANKKKSFVHRCMILAYRL